MYKFSLFLRIALFLALVFNHQKLLAQTFDSPEFLFLYASGIDLKACNKNPESPEFSNKAYQEFHDDFTVHKWTYAAELAQKLPIWQDRWNKIWSSYLIKPIGQTIGPFFDNRVKISMFSCPILTSMGTPLLVNAIHFLESASSKSPYNQVHIDYIGSDGIKDPWPETLLFALIQHEFLHGYINEFLKKSAIVERLKAENTVVNLPDTVRCSQDPCRLSDLNSYEQGMFDVHLHMFALMQEIWRQNPKTYSLVKRHQQGFGAGYYAAWDLVERASQGDAFSIENLKLELIEAYQNYVKN